MSVKLEKVCFSYQDNTQVISDLSLTAKNGEITVIIGNNATGKSTLAKLICGLLEPSSGKVFSNNEASLVMQNPQNQLFEKTVLKDVMFGPVNLGLSNPEDKAKKALKTVGLDSNVYDKSPFALSGGQQKRCAIAGVIAMNRKTVVFDEAIAGLDAQGKEQYFAILKSEKAKKHAVISFTHNPDEIKIADKVYELVGGKLKPVTK